MATAEHQMKHEPVLSTGPVCGCPGPRPDMPILVSLPLTQSLNSPTQGENECEAPSPPLGICTLKNRSVNGFPSVNTKGMPGILAVWEVFGSICPHFFSYSMGGRAPLRLPRPRQVLRCSLGSRPSLQT